MSAARPGRDRPAGPLRVGVADRVLTATYRLQLHDGFTFADAAAQLERLQALGISHLYLSPSLEAVPGSTHGYDVTDPTRIRATLGGEDGLRALASRAHEVGMGLILDIVPNHVGLVSPVNPWWFDTLAHGPDSRFGRHLDVFWQPGAHGQPTLLVPELGERLPQALAGDALQLAHVDDGRVPAWRVVYHDHQWPVRPGSLAAVGLDVAELDPDDAEVARAVTACREDRTLLAALLDHQHYRLGFWRRANDELDHRRFFDIDTLGAVRIEDPAVFADVHAAVLPLLADGTLDGLRIDHPDGLADPVGYLRRLRAAVGPEPWLIVEKILEHDEPYRADWPIDGTVGYGFADRVLGLHIDPAAGPVFDDLQTSLVGAPFDREAQADAAKRTALDTLFGAERARLAAALAAADPELADDPAVDDLDALLGELLVVWPVYRTYVRHDDDLADPEVPSEDVAVIGRAVARATARRPELGPAFERVRGLLDGTVRTAQAATFVTRFQQLTGPAIAKGLEDTVLYRDTRFVAVNEVGADPGHLGASVAEVHDAHRRAVEERPATMRLLSTHDTKRSADVRARLAVLSQDPGRWVRAAWRLQALAAPHRSAAGPTPAHEHLAWQTAVGAWPIDAERLGDYLVKAAREGKEATTWLAPDTGYEEALRRYAQALTGDPALVAAIDAIVAEVAAAGRATSLAMVLVTACGPGVPDVYQGDETWSHTLVDPDNRRDVDHAALAAVTAAVQPPAIPERAAEVWQQAATGAVKTWVWRRVLEVRASRPASFGPGAAYRACWARGPRSAHVLGFRRGDDVLAVVATRVAMLGATPADWAWEGTTIEVPEGSWRDVMSGRRHAGGTLPLARLLQELPVALLVAEDDGQEGGL